MQAKRRKSTTSLRLPEARLREIDDLVARIGMRSRTDFFERAVEAYIDELREAKVIVVRKWTDAKAKRAITEFLRTRPSAYVSEIAEALGMDFDLAFRIAGELMEGGVIGRAT